MKGAHCLQRGYIDILKYENIVCVWKFGIVLTIVRE